MYLSARTDAAGVRSANQVRLATQATLTDVLSTLSAEDYFVTVFEEYLLDAETAGRPLSAAQCAEMLMDVLSASKDGGVFLQSRGVYVISTLDTNAGGTGEIVGDLQFEVVNRARAHRALRRMVGFEWQSAVSAGLWIDWWGRRLAVLPGFRSIDLSPRLELLLTTFDEPAARKRATAEVHRLLRGPGTILSEDVTFLLRRTGVTVADLLDWAADVAARTAHRVPRSAGSRLSRKSRKGEYRWKVDLLVVSRDDSIWTGDAESLPDGDFLAVLRAGVGEATAWVTDEDSGMKDVTPSRLSARAEQSRHHVRHLVGEAIDGPVWARSIVRDSRFDNV